MLWHQIDDKVANFEQEINSAKANNFIDRPKLSSAVATRIHHINFIQQKSVDLMIHIYKPDCKNTSSSFSKYSVRATMISQLINQKLFEWLEYYLIFVLSTIMRIHEDTPHES